MKRVNLYIAAVILAMAYPTTSRALSLMQPMLCEFQNGQYLDPSKDRTYSEKAPLEWSFFDLLGKTPTYFSGGDSGSILVYRQTRSDGVSLWLTQGNGAHLISIWPDGTAFWSQHNDIWGMKATQQFRGTCDNIRR